VKCKVLLRNVLKYGVTYWLKKVLTLIRLTSRRIR